MALFRNTNDLYSFCLAAGVLVLFGVVVLRVPFNGHWSFHWSISVQNHALFLVNIFSFLPVRKLPDQEFLCSHTFSCPVSLFVGGYNSICRKFCIHFVALNLEQTFEFFTSTSRGRERYHRHLARG